MIGERDIFNGSRSYRFLVHDGQHLFLFKRDETRSTGAINRHQISLTTIPLARHSSGDEARPLRGQADKVRVHVARYPATSGRI